MNEHPLEKLRRLLGEQWSPQWVANEAIERACAEIERLRAHRAEQVPTNCKEQLRAVLEGLECEQIELLMTQMPVVLRLVGERIALAAKLGAHLLPPQPHSKP